MGNIEHLRDCTITSATGLPHILLRKQSR